jgi:prepilin peptidase CpaA
MPNAASLIDWSHWLALFVFASALLAAAMSDALTYLIPNRYSAAIIAAFFVFAAGRPLAFSLNGLASGVLVFAVVAVLFQRRMLGGGDAKLLTACAVWAGFDLLPLLIFTSALAGGVLALVQLSPLGRLLPAPPAGSLGATDMPNKLRQPMPFGVAVALGGVCVALARLVA